ncbi:VWA domain-containing protein [Georgenia subflava]|uniref:VWA domain-containing protein n=1 Tax=Georgenia subflava TaxID=1622177 RepID=A0A6N7EIP4_9MICO|nr:VWA domain-containing protein [Georgenia subflava]MPV37950.1 VWA domain-containing protein [Georgenia subflava]
MDGGATRRNGLILAGALGLVVILVVVGVLVWGVRRADAPEQAASAPAPTSAAACDAPVDVRVTTTADFAPVVETAAERLMSDDGCTTYTVTAATSADAAELISTGADVPHVWIPDSDVWVARVNLDREEPALVVGPTLATSPVVLAVPTSMARSTRITGPQPWQAILTGPLELRLAEPDESTTSLLLLYSASAALGATPQGEQLLGARIITMSRQTAPEDELLTWASTDDEGAPALPATEQQILRQRGTNSDTPLEAVVPAEAAAAVTYSWVPIPGPDFDDSMQLAVSELEESLTGEAGQADREEAGFRGPDGTEIPGGASLATGAVTTMPGPSIDAAEAVATTWSTVSVDMRMLAVIDVSGSMLQPAGDQTRIALAGASAQTALKIFPPTSQVGLWMFSTDHRNGNDWTELAPIAPLAVDSGTGTHRDALLAAAATLPIHTRGDTGLYDTVLAAYREVQENYEPGYVNSVVLLTDGRNEDAVGISLDELLAQLQASVEPSKPIPIITVGMGPGTDEEVLRLIAAQTGGRSYLARNPADISTVFVDALTHRFRAG